MDDLGKEREKLNGKQQQFQVPPGIRTRLAIPRIVAGIITILSVVAFYTGTQALQNQQLQNRSALDNVFQLGYRQWGIRTLGEDAQCIGALYSEMVIEPVPRVLLNGIINLPHSGEPKRVDIDGEVLFTSYYSLETINLALKIDQAHLTMTSFGENASTVELEVNSPKGKFLKSFPRPQPIFLRQLVPGYFSLRLPEEYGAQFQMNMMPAEELDRITGLEMRLLRTDEVAGCYEELDKDFKFPEEVLDVGKYSSVIQLGLGTQLRR